MTFVVRSAITKKNFVLWYNVGIRTWESGIRASYSTSDKLTNKHHNLIKIRIKMLCEKRQSTVRCSNTDSSALKPNARKND